MNNSDYFIINKKSNNQNVKENDKIKIKKVKFSEPEFVKIIELESYKKFNVINSYKEPLDNENSEDINKSKQDKENVLCSCLVI